MTHLSQNLSSERLVLESWGKDQSYSYLILHNKIEKLKSYSLSKPCLKGLMVKDVRMVELATENIPIIENRRR